MLRTIVVLLDSAFLLFLLFTFYTSATLDSAAKWALLLYAAVLTLNLLVLSE